MWLSASLRLCGWGLRHNRDTPGTLADRDRRHDLARRHIHDGDIIRRPVRRVERFAVWRQRNAPWPGANPDGCHRLVGPRIDHHHRPTTSRRYEHMPAIGRAHNPHRPDILAGQMNGVNDAMVVRIDH